MNAALLLLALALSDAQAGQIVAGCAAHATAKGQSHAIAVVDPGGRLLAFRRMDGNAYGIGEFAREKAEAAAAWRARTADLARGAAATPGFADGPEVVIVAGGVPVYASVGQFIGAVGVSGEAPAVDEAGALAGIDAASLLASPPAARR
jgi:uncharacterized protein GlcG (DUF336 family)